MFKLFCIIIMWPMLFSVPVLYANMTSKIGMNSTYLITTLALFMAFLSWVVFGYFITFTSNMSWTSYNTYLQQIQTGDYQLILSVILQACFFLYAVGMFVGTLIHKVHWGFFVAFVPLWLLLVYAPLAYMIWNSSGILNQAGVLDFSGGLVVHVSAGFTSLFMIRHYQALPDKEMDANSTSHFSTNYIATALICFGWFGFNLGPLENIDGTAGLIAINTMIAIVGGGLGFVFYMQRTVDIDSLLSGMIVGLVTSTALVGYISPIEVFIVTTVSGYLVCLCKAHLQLDDPVDSFVLNGIGGLVGSIGCILFANPLFTPNGQSGLLMEGRQMTFVFYQTFAIVVTVFITWIGTELSMFITQRIYNRKKVLLHE